VGLKTTVLPSFVRAGFEEICQLLQHPTFEINPAIFAIALIQLFRLMWFQAAPWILRQYLSPLHLHYPLKRNATRDSQHLKSLRMRILCLVPTTDKFTHIEQQSSAFVRWIRNQTASVHTVTVRPTSPSMSIATKQHEKKFGLSGKR
jgi:hypothetical protein